MPGRTLLKRAGPVLFVGTDDGYVVLDYVMPGAQVTPGIYRAARRLKEQRTLRFLPFEPTRSRPTQYWGHDLAQIATSDGFTMQEYIAPGQLTCVAGFDRQSGEWVVE